MFLSQVIYKITIKTLTSDNSAYESRTGVIPLTFFIGRYLWFPKMRSKIPLDLEFFLISLPKVKKVKLGSRFRMARGSVEINSHHILTFCSPVMKKTLFFDPKMTSDHMTLLFENVPPTDLHLVPKYQMSWAFTLQVIASWIFSVFCQYLTLCDPYGHQKQ